MKNSQRGFSVLDAILAIVALAAIGAAAYFAVWGHKTTTVTVTKTVTMKTSATPVASPVAPVSLVKNGTYYDSPQGYPGYQLTVTNGQAGAISGNLIYEYQDGRTENTFAYTASAAKSPFTLTATPATSLPVVVSADGSNLILTNCQQYLAAIELQTTCTFSPR